MKKSLLGVALVLSVSSLAAQAQELAGAKDYPLFPRMPGFVITGYVQEKATMELPTSNEKKQVVTGLRTAINYTYQGKRGRSYPTRNELEGHYLNVGLQLGNDGQPYHTFRSTTAYTIKGRHDGKVLWLHVSDFHAPAKGAGVASFRLTVVEAEPEK